MNERSLLKNLLVTSSLLLFHKPALSAQVNVKDASFSETLHLIEREPAFDLAYSSRSLFRGMFGFGWQLGMEKNQTSWKTKFDRQGRLFLAKKGTKKFSFFYSQKLPWVSKISFGAKILAEFSYIKDCLSQIKLANGKVYTFKYDGQKNLTLIDDGKDIQRMTYNTRQDQLLSYKNRQCEDQFLYLKLPSPDKFLVKRKHTCKKQKPLNTIFEFTYRRAQDGLRVLTNLKIVGPKDEELVVFDNIGGRIQKQIKSVVQERIGYEAH